MYAALKWHICECEQPVYFLGQGQAGVRDLMRRAGLYIFSSDDGETVDCPNCGVAIPSPIPELFDLDRSTFGRKLLEIDAAGRGGGDTVRIDGQGA